MSKQEIAEKWGLTVLDRKQPLETKDAAGKVVDPYDLILERAAKVKEYMDRGAVLRVDHNDWKEKRVKSAGGRLRKALLKEIIEPTTGIRELLNEIRGIARTYRQQILDELKQMKADKQADTDEKDDDE